MSRVAMIEGPHAPLLARRFYERGDPGAIVAALAHVPEMLEVAMPFIGSVLGASYLSTRIKEIVILRTSSILECRYCINSHSVVAIDAGLSRTEVLALRGELPIEPNFSDACERAVLAWVDCVVPGPGLIPEDVAAHVRLHFSDADIVELTLVAATTLMLNRFCTSLGLPNSSETLARLSDEGLQ